MAKTPASHNQNIPMQYHASFHGSMNVLFHFIFCDIFLILHLQSTFLSQNKKNNVYPNKPHFSFYKVKFYKVLIKQTC